MRRYDVTALGELLIDFTENGYSSQGNPVFEANPGGAPCNVLAMLAKLGYSAAFIGKVGRDCFGDQLQSAIREAGIQRRISVERSGNSYHTGVCPYASGRGSGFLLFTEIRAPI